MTPMMFRSGVLCVVGALVATVGVLVAPTSSAVPAASVAATSVIVTGTSTGLGMGAIVRPMVKFPGQTSYTQGTASILVDEAGDFTWQRRTGKKTYVYVKTEDGTARSNRVIIPAG
jgi:hypothetical protein